MNLRMFLRSLLGQPSAGTITTRGSRFRPTLESLEDRLAPALFMVTNANDAGPGSLRQAILSANVTAAADSIKFASSMTNKTITLTSGELLITNPVAVVGLGSNKLTIDAANTSRIFTIDDGTVANVAVFLYGLKLTHGKADDGNPANLVDANRGGAIFNREALTVTSSVLQENSALRQGGAIYQAGGTLTVSKSALSGNNADEGGAINNNSAGLTTLSFSTLTDNHATMDGGAIFSQSAGTVVVTNTAFTLNTASSSGGAILNGGALALSNASFTENSAGFGGAIYNNDGDLTVTNSHLVANSATSQGGGIYNLGGSATVGASTLDGNTAVSGGAIHVQGGTLTLTDATLSNNTATSGGGAMQNFSGGTVTIQSSRLFHNSATSGSAGGIHNAGVLTLRDSTQITPPPAAAAASPMALAPR